MWSEDFQMFKLDLEQVEEPEIKLSTTTGSSKMQESSKEASTFAFLTMPKPLTVWITCRKFWKRWEYQTTWPASWEICIQVKKQQLEPNREQQTGSKSGKEYVKAVYCHPAYLTYMHIMRNAGLDEAQTVIKIAGRNINNLRYADVTTLMAESEEELKSLLMKVKEESEEVGLKLNIQKTKIMASGPITSWQIHGKTWKQWQTLFSYIPKSPQMVTAAMKLKDPCSLGKSYAQPRQHIKKQRHYFANKGLSSQSYGFSSSHVWMWELDYKKNWAPKNWCIWTVVLE